MNYLEENTHGTNFFWLLKFKTQNDRKYSEENGFFCISDF